MTYSNISDEKLKRAISNDFNIDVFLLSGLACMFNDIKMYHM